jgi:hypothetical protein
MECYLATPQITQNGGNLQSSAAWAYQWYYNNSPLAGATSQVCTPLQNGNYVVVISDSLGCSASSAPFNVTGVGINVPQDEENSVIVFPNPAGKNFSVIVPSTALQIVICNSLGQTVETGLVNGRSMINFSIDAAGMYFIHVTGEKAILTKKIVIMK